MIWLSQALSPQSTSMSNTLADITLADSSGITANGVSQYRMLPIFAPFGISYLPPVGEKALLSFSQDTPICIGTAASTVGLASGELRLSIPSGASIHLKNDGSVIINGQRFPPANS